jgi:DNA polymerase (family 10)
MKAIMEPTLNPYIAAILDRTASLMEIDGHDHAEVLACRSVAAGIRDGRQPRLSATSHWGRIAAELLDQGASPTYAAWTVDLPESLLELVRIPGFTPATVRLLRERLAVYSWFDLYMLLGESRHKLAAVPEVHQGVWALAAAYLKARRPVLPSVFLGVEGLASLQALLAAWEAHGPGWPLYPVGAVAQGREMISQIELVAAAGQGRLEMFWAFLADFEREAERFASPLAGTLRFGERQRPRSEGPVLVRQTPDRLVVRLANGMPVSIALVPETHLVAELVRRRSAEAHWAQVAHGEDVSPLYRDLFDLEAAFYRSRGLSYVPPELRDGPVDPQVWRTGSQHRLLSEADMRGDLHMHTVWSDGKGTIEAMVQRAEWLGYDYIAICEHSPYIQAANGLDPDRLRRHRAEIEGLRSRHPHLRILAGAEVDILPDGQMDYADDVLAGLDLVIGSIHTHFDLDRESQTRRLERAMANPHVDIIGHPTGRILNNCPAYALDVTRILAGAARTGTVLEVNATPNRLDLPARVAAAALAAGVTLAINTDSHSPEGMAAMPLGVSQARRAGAHPAQILNTRSAEALLDWLHMPKSERRHTAVPTP